MVDIGGNKIIIIKIKKKKKTIYMSGFSIWASLWISGFVVVGVWVADLRWHAAVLGLGGWSV